MSRPSKNAHICHIGFVSGCFDLFHFGHASLLDQAASQCSTLIVGVNSDRSVRILKGSGRPIMDQLERSFMVRAHAAVDAAIIFDALTPDELIAAIRPDVIFRGDDGTPIEHVPGYGIAGRIQLITKMPISTTEIIRRVDSAIAARIRDGGA